MKDRAKPLFLARQSYRRRRMIDASRLVPLFGGAVMLLPLLWTGAEHGSLAVRGLLLFAAWGVLVAASAFLARLLTEAPDSTATPTRKGEPEGSDVL